MVPEIWSEMDIFFCHFGTFYALSPPNNKENLNFEKMKKRNWRCHHFTHVYQKSKSYDVCFLSIWSVADKIFVISGPFFALLPH